MQPIDLIGNQLLYIMKSMVLCFIMRNDDIYAIHSIEFELKVKFCYAHTIDSLCLLDPAIRYSLTFVIKRLKIASDNDDLFYHSLTHQTSQLLMEVSQTKMMWLRCMRWWMMWRFKNFSWICCMKSPIIKCTVFEFHIQAQATNRGFETSWSN